jgi:hypothetical protein
VRQQEEASLIRGKRTDPQVGIPAQVVHPSERTSGVVKKLDSEERRATVRLGMETLREPQRHPNHASARFRSPLRSGNWGIRLLRTRPVPPGYARGRLDRWPAPAALTSGHGRKARRHPPPLLGGTGAAGDRRAGAVGEAPDGMRVVVDRCLHRGTTGRSLLDWVAAEGASPHTAPPRSCVAAKHAGHRGFSESRSDTSVNASV